MPNPNGNYIAGEWTGSSDGETSTTINPANVDEVVGTYPSSTVSDTDDAVAAANDAADEWADTPASERGDILRRTAALLDERAEEATELIAREEGKTLSEAAPEVGRVVDIFYYYAEKAKDFGGTVKQPSGRRQTLHTETEPLGVAGLITPWNYPIAIPAWKIAPALATGNTVVIKPAEVAPGVVRILVECLESAGLPDGVINLVNGRGSVVGERIISHDDVDVVSFTGSTQVGEQVYRTSVDDGKRAQAEMGGKNPAVVTPSADLEEAVETVAAGAFGVTGQACTATSRAIVHEDVYDEFLEEIVEAAESIEVGPGSEDPDMGAHVSESELEGTLEYVDVAKEDGATLLTGGNRLDEGELANGYFVEPTVFADVDTGMRIAQEEVFGPLLAVIPVSDFDEAVETANDTEYGLSASILSEDYVEINEFIERVESGVVKVNEKTTGLELHVPFGGMKRSSTNTYREQGDAGLAFFTTTKTVYGNY